MALVAYSDDSDLGTDTEEGDEGGGVKVLDGKTSLGGSIKKSAIRVESGVDSIEDEEDERVNIPKSEESSSLSRGLFCNVPAPVPVSDLFGAAGVEEEDEVLDVPTVETWKVTQELKKQTKSTLPSSSNSQSNTLRKEKKKVKILLPSLSEFADDDDSEEEKEKPPKKVKPSSSGSGLFSVLPEPKHQSAKETGRSLVPHILTKRSSQPQKLKKKPSPPVAATPAVGEHSSDDDDDKTPAVTDFFSLSKPSVVDDIIPVEDPLSSTVPAAVTTPSVEPIKAPPRVPNTQSMELQPVDQKQYQDYEDEGRSSMVLSMPEPIESTTVPAASGGIDEAAILRLAGKRGRAEAINFIDVNADDALLTRDEWMTKALSEEKPQHGFSKKREGLPTQKQKQKHQITYLAHQAKERELDLKNTWAQNRMTKMQSQAKYGF